MSELSLDEMGEVVDQVVSCEFNKTVIGKVLSGEIVWPEDAQALKDSYKQQFFKSNRKFIKILKGELKDLPLEVHLNITNDSKNMAMMSDKVSSVFTQVSQILMLNPSFFDQHPEMAKLFNQVLEASGLASINFGIKGHQQQMQGMQMQAMQQKQLTPQPNAQIPQQIPQQAPAGLAAVPA
jgi:hypothetical protein